MRSSQKHNLPPWQYANSKILVFKFFSQPQKTGTKTESCQLAKIRLEWISRSPLGLVIDGLNTTASLYRIAPCLCTYQRPSRGVDPRDIRGKGAGFADFCRQFLALDGGIGPLLHFRGEVHGERPAEFVTSPPSWKWKGLGIICVALFSKHGPK